MTARKPDDPAKFKRCKECLGDFPPRKMHSIGRRCWQCEALRQRVLRAEARGRFHPSIPQSARREAQQAIDLDRYATVKQQAGLNQALEVMAKLTDEMGGPQQFADWLIHRVELAERYSDEKTALRMMGIVATIGGLAAMVAPDEVEDRIARLGARRSNKSRRTR